MATEPGRGYSSTVRPSRSLALSSFLCVAIYGVAVSIIWPVAELATDDDFAYARMALIFERTGHLAFNGWETAMIGWQVAWGALFIRLFGFSYFNLRLSTILLGAFLTLLLHRVLLRTGAAPVIAVLGTLTLVLSPLFLPMAASYMTDVPSLLCILVCFYGCQRALTARSDRAALLWLCGSALLNVLDGTVRQIAWLGALVIVPSAFWLVRRRPRFAIAGLITWVLSAAAISGFVHWFLRQPYVLPEHILQADFNWVALRHVLRLCVYGPLEVLCFSLPLLVAWIFDLRAISRRRKLHILIACAALVPFALLAAHFNQIQGRLPPWSANVVSRYGILWAVPLLGTSRAEMLPNSITLMITIGLIACATGFFLWLGKNVRRELLDRPTQTPSSGIAQLSLYQSCVLTLPFSAIYFCLLMPRAAANVLFYDVFDRYYLPLILVAIILLSRLLTKRVRQVPVACYTILVVFSFFAVTATHDLFVAYRATARVRSMVESSGISPLVISGPWQEDGLNQIKVAGYLNDTRVGPYQRDPHPPLEYCHYWYGPLVPALHFQYVLTIEPLDCLVPSQFPDTIYQTWLPPYRRTIYVERNPTGR